MSWIKRNLFFVIGAVVALAFLGFAGYYDYSGWQHNNEQLEKLNQAYSDLKQVTENPFLGATGGKVDNIQLAGEQQKQLRQFLGKVGGSFKRIPAIPGSGANITGAEYASALRLTIDQLQREATNNSLVLPAKYNFSFERQRQLVQFAGSLEPLAVQLGEVKAICDILNKAKINSLDSLRRERVSADDATGPQTDYLETHSQTNEMGVLSPYEITFRSFSPELAAVLAGFASSPHGIVVRSLNVEPAQLMTPETLVSTPVMPVAPPVYYQPAPVRQPFNPDSDAFASRYGGKGGPPPAVAPAPVYMVPAGGGGSGLPRGGLPVLLNERPLKVTMLVEVVKLLPKK